MNPHLKDPSSIKAISPAQSLTLLREVYDQLDAGSELKPSVIEKLARSEAFIGALAIADLSKVDDLFSDLRCLYRCAKLADAMRVAVVGKRPNMDDLAGDMDDDVWASLDKRINAEGTVVAVVGSQLNVKKVLMGDPKWEGRIRRNTFAHQTEVDGEPKSDIGETSLHLWLDEVYRLNCPSNKIGETMDYVGECNQYHPIREYLEGLKWDGKPRLDGWLIDYCGSPDKKIVRAYARRWAISAVARVMEPGCKVDTTLILQGEQGTNKSSAFQALCHDPKWFSDSAIDLGNKDAMQALQGVWIYEFPELSTFKRSDTSSAKAFLASAVDRFRPSYGRNMVRTPRQCVICGSTNETNFLKDPTGSRRYWPVETPGSIVGPDGIKKIDLEGLRAVRDQIWAEALALYKTGEQWWLTAEEEKRRKQSAFLFTEEDHLLVHVAEWLAKKNLRTISITEIEAAPVHKLGVRLNSTTRNRVVEILRLLGYEKMKRGRQGRRWTIKTAEWESLREAFGVDDTPIQ